MFLELNICLLQVSEINTQIQLKIQAVYPYICCTSPWTNIYGFSNTSFWLMNCHVSLIIQITTFLE